MKKLPFSSPHVHPRFSVLDPETTFSLPKGQVANGIVDAYAHTLEQYLTYPANAPLPDRMAEAILKTLIEERPKTLANPTDYDARANVMWCPTTALNGLGAPQDWALRALDHGQTLAVVCPGTMAARRAVKGEDLM